MSRRYKLNLILFSVVAISILVELFRHTFTSLGDFRGYVLVGNLLLDGENIYSDPKINTWPPFFSIVSVPIALIDNFNRYLVRFLWLVGSLLAMFQIMNYSTQFGIKRRLSFFPVKSGILITEDKISVLHWIVLIPLLISLRYLIANLSYIQINVYMLFFAMYSFYTYSQGREIPGALVLAFSISIKVYTIFVLLYFLIKREFKIAAYTILFCCVFAAIPFLVFGIEQAVDYYSRWYEYTMSQFAIVGHKNQSFFSMIRSLLVHESPGLEGMPLNKAIYVNIFDLTIHQVKIISYSILALTGSVVVYLFRRKTDDRKSLRSFIEYAFILTIIPILSPISWKAYFIFLFPSYFLNYLFLYQYKNELKRSTVKYLKFSYFLSILLTVFSTELFVGNYFSDILEVFSVITIGTILIAINLLIVYMNMDKFTERINRGT